VCGWLTEMSSDGRTALRGQCSKDVGEMRASLYLWWWQFRAVIKRNFTNYYRNPSHVAARCFVMLLVAALQVRSLGSRRLGGPGH
jgi:hypothetical protein